MGRQVGGKNNLEFKRNVEFAAAAQRQEVDATIEFAYQTLQLTLAKPD